MRHLVVLVVACVAGAFAAPAAAAPTRPLSEADIAQIRTLMSASPFDEGTWGMLATDVETGRELFSLNADKLFHSASTTKNFTTGAALDELGPRHRFRTPLLRTGPVSASGALEGVLILRASGDLTMGGRALPNGDVAYTGFDHMDANEVPGEATLTPQSPVAGLDALAQRTRRRGIRSVQDVVVDDRLWRSKKIGAEVVSPIVVNDNAIDITMRPTKPGQRVRARTRPATAAYDIDVRVRTVAAGGPTNVVVGEAKGRKVTVTGTLAADTSRPFVQIFRVPDPAYFARTLLIEALERAGVRVGAATVGRNPVGELPTRRVVARRLPRVAQLTSPRLGQFVKLIQKVSHNLGANTVPFWLGVQAGRPTFAEGMRQIRAYARKAGVPRGQARLVDGQGGPPNRISPNAMVTLLRYIQTRPYGRVFLRALPVKGIDGIPSDPDLDPATGHVFAKNGLTGALNAKEQIEVQAMALAGYAIAGDRRVAFNVVANHIPIYGPDGKYSEAPGVLSAAFTRFGNHEAITTLLYTSQVGE
jgi:D-alanyl-D-alanine carboxypeptidase/D-alanyl-D-alanine-endopeptidase (penicillin-binding protein 4)